ncbi:ATP synthase subunit I [Pantoea sp. Aalb]|uniref:ATP synthase subunit I n=1 Tax=Pantoea sp. Aalb TaxID=2576762 RepID=UPI00132240F3|nr:ATP synthase subunit I [Pantoea sp. Aalb]MXP67612.1 ATP F0F1 synthase subunit I [Pantoea sp. Aalb]
MPHILFISMKSILKLLFIQLFLIGIISTFFSLKSISWGLSALAGGVAAWLPTMVFIFVSQHLNIFVFNQTKMHKKLIAWNFVLGELIKIFMMVIFFIVALVVFKAFFLPLIITWLLIMILQIILLIVIHK